MHRRQRRVEDNGARSRIDFVLMSKLLNNSPNNFDLADAGGGTTRARFAASRVPSANERCSVDYISRALRRKLARKYSTPVYAAGDY